MEDPSRDLSARLGAWIQPRYEFSSDAASQRLSSFYMRRVRLDLAGQIFSDRLGYRSSTTCRGTAS